MRLSTFDKPRVIACGEDLPGHVALPRGCLAEVVALLAPGNRGRMFRSMKSVKPCGIASMRFRRRVLMNVELAQLYQSGCSGVLRGKTGRNIIDKSRVDELV